MSFFTPTGATRPLTPSDTPNAHFNWVLANTTGSLVYDTAGGDTVTVSAIPAGVWLPVGNARNIRTTSTAGGFIVA